VVKYISGNFFYIMSIQCIKILGYNLRPTHDPMSNFAFICKVLNQSIDPPTQHYDTLEIRNGIILCSPLARARQCLKYSPDGIVAYPRELVEIPFDLAACCTIEEWLEKGSIVVRKKFKEAFIGNTLLISRQEIMQQAKKIFAECRQCGATTIVSHTFRLILLKAIYETNGKIIDKPKLIHNYIDDQKRILDFGETFNL